MLIIIWYYVSFDYSNHYCSFIFCYQIMLNFFYESLETVQKLKFPKQEDYIQMSSLVFLAIIVAGLYFMLTDTVISQLYSTVYQLLRG